MRQKKSVTQKGYTLVELAIVLVIIGFLMGGIAIGRELIESAKLKSIISDFENLKQAHYLYIKRTGNPPGLRRDANGIVTVDTWGGGIAISSIKYFEDLIAEGLVAGVKPDDNVIRHAYGGSWSVSPAPTPMGGAVIDGMQICADSLYIGVAHHIDKVLDDGVSNTGEVLAVIDNRNQTGIVDNYANERNNQPKFTVCRAF